jgi:hypothetical protein
MKRRQLLAIAAVVALAFPVVCRADLTVKEETRMSGMMGMLSSKGTETTYIKGDRMRTESQTQMGGAMGGMVQGAGASQSVEMTAITRLDKGVLWLVDDSDSTYVEVPLAGEGADSAAGVEVRDVAVTKTGRTKEIVGYKCDGVEVAISLEVKMGDGGEAEVQTHSIKTLFWMRSEVKGLEELRHFWDQMVDIVRASQQGSPMADALGPLFAKVKEIQGVPLGMEMTMANPMAAAAGEADQAEMKEAMRMVQQIMKQQGTAAGDEPAGDESGDIRVTRQVTSISRGALGDGLFEVPKGYKKTTQSMPQMMKQR